MEGRRDEVTDLGARLEALEAALELGEPWLDPIVVQQARVTVQRSVMRVRLGVDHTVVALVGATGSGKSSLFNALARMEIAPVGARRPTTSLPMACVWGEGGSEELLDWLDVPASLRVTRESVLDADLQAPLHGLVLLDLPDHDSTEVMHRVQVDRLVTMVDLLVWVVDPQKYADNALHAGYLQKLVGHDAVMVVVLNQIDRLGDEEADTCVQDLRRLLDGDGLAAVAMLPVSAKRGDGVDDLRTILAEVVQDRSAIVERVAADLNFAIDGVQDGLAPVEPGDGTPPGGDRLVEELSEAAGVPVVIEAVAAEYRRRGWIRARWPVLDWLRRLGRKRREDAVGEHDLKVITGGLTPVTAPSLRPQVELAVEKAVALSADPLPVRWAEALRDNVSQADDDLVATLDRSVREVDLSLAPPPWWWLVTVAQYLLGIGALIGAAWLLLLGVAELVNSDFVSSLPVLGVPLPMLLLVLGLIGGGLLTAFSAWMLAIGARRRRLAAQDRLNAAVRAVVDTRLMTPIQAVLDQHRLTREALAGRWIAEHRASHGVPAPVPVEAVSDAGTRPGDPVGSTEWVASSAPARSMDAGSRGAGSMDGGSMDGGTAAESAGAGAKMAAPALLRGSGAATPPDSTSGSGSRTLTV
jgi:GTP-binding protein EngB required for normal cell division